MMISTTSFKPRLQALGKNLKPALQNAQKQLTTASQEASHFIGKTGQNFLATDSGKKLQGAVSHLQTQAQKTLKKNPSLEAGVRQAQGVLHDGYKQVLSAWKTHAVPLVEKSQVYLAKLFK